MNNYQTQQWNNISSIIGFATSIIFMGFMVGMTKDWIGEIAKKEPYTIHPWLYDKFGGKKLQDAPWEERYKVAQRIGAQLDLEYNIPCKAQKVGTVEIPIDYWNKNRDHVADALDEITRVKHKRPWRKELSSSSSNVITSKLPKDITIPPKEIREGILKDIRRGGYGPKWALETLSGYYSIEPPTLVTMPELNVISSCLYGEAEDTWGWGAEGMYMPREKAWRICRIRTNEDFIVINPETDVTEYPYHLIHEFYHHLFKRKPTLLRGYERDEEYAVYMIVHEWIAGE